MLTVDDALAICRMWASWDGDPVIGEEFIQIKSLTGPVLRLLVELQLARDEAEHYRAQLIQWGIPTKRRTIKRLESGGFERGWE